jgi:hypothetical protein
VGSLQRSSQLGHSFLLFSNQGSAMVLMDAAAQAARCSSVKSP